MLIRKDTPNHYFGIITLFLQVPLVAEEHIPTFLIFPYWKIENKGEAGGIFTTTKVALEK